mmetsp:Transcript_9616/g.23416  ORF Transcript_9616/g.23416 Transcript_9616/m.23416 type:complete len:201 (+) Transcript_9616:1443-2045(+)
MRPVLLAADSHVHVHVRGREISEGERDVRLVRWVHACVARALIQSEGLDEHVSGAEGPGDHNLYDRSRDERVGRRERDREPVVPRVRRPRGNNRVAQRRCDQHRGVDVDRLALAALALGRRAVDLAPVVEHRAHLDGASVPRARHVDHRPDLDAHLREARGIRLAVARHGDDAVVVDRRHEVPVRPGKEPRVQRREGREL